MAATIIAFPDIHERNDREFDRTGSTSYIRAIDEAHELGGMRTGQSLDRPAYLKRVAALEVIITGLATWRAVDDILPIELSGGGEVRIRIRDVASFLRNMIGHEVAAPAQRFVAPRRRKPTCVLEDIAGITLGRFEPPPINGQEKPTICSS